MGLFAVAQGRRLSYTLNKEDLKIYKLRDTSPE